MIDFFKKKPFLVIPVLFLPLLACVLYVLKFGVNVMVWDEFLLADLYGKHFTAHLHWLDFWAQHNEHRLLFPKLFLFYLGLATRHNSKIFMLIVVAFLALFCLVLYASERGKHQDWGYLWFLPVPFLVLSFRQWGNLLWGFQPGFG